MADNESMKIKFRNSLVFGWKEVIAFVAVLLTCACVYVGMQHSIQDSANKIEEISNRMVVRSGLVDSNFATVNNSVNELKTSVAVLQSNQVVISKQIDTLQRLILEERAKPAVYKMGGDY